MSGANLNDKINQLTKGIKSEEKKAEIANAIKGLPSQAQDIIFHGDKTKHVKEFTDKAEIIKQLQDRPDLQKVTAAHTMEYVTKNNIAWNDLMKVAHGEKGFEVETELKQNPELKKTLDKDVKDYNDNAKLAVATMESLPKEALKNLKAMQKDYDESQHGQPSHGVHQGKKTAAKGNIPIS